MTSNKYFVRMLTEQPGMKLVQASEVVIGKFRATGEPCTLEQVRALEDQIGDAALERIEWLEGEILKANLARYLDRKFHATRH